jgi:hypothetical protein
MRLSLVSLLATAKGVWATRPRYGRCTPRRHESDFMNAGLSVGADLFCLTACYCGFSWVIYFVSDW